MKYAWVEAPIRLLMALLFLVSATIKMADTAAIQAYMHAYGAPEILVWPAAACEYTAGTLLLVGFCICPVAVLPAGWCVLTAVIFHTEWSNLDQLMNFFKNLTMVGGVPDACEEPVMVREHRRCARIGQANISLEGGARWQ